MQWLIDNATSTYTFPEAIHPRTNGGCVGDGHHGWAAAEFIHLIRNMLFFEEGGTLVITPIIPQRWIEPGEIIEVKNAPSYFGEINFKIESTYKMVVLDLDNHYIKSPEYIEFSLPVRIRKIRIDGKERKILGRTIRFSSEVKKVIAIRE
mgnify:CR=1 FL=1